MMQLPFFEANILYLCQKYILKIIFEIIKVQSNGYKAVFRFKKKSLWMIPKCAPPTPVI